MIIKKSPAELELMAQSGKIVADMHELVAESVRPGVTTAELDAIAEEYILAQGAVPAFKGYPSGSDAPAFPGTLCTSINDEIVHGIPCDRTLLEGDIIKIDAGCIVEGYYSDSAVTWIVGGADAVDDEVRELVELTRVGLWTGIMAAQKDRRVGDISSSVEKLGNEHNFGIVREYVGHGVGRSLHEDPQVPNHGKKGRGPKLSKGLVIAIEPMFNLGTHETMTLQDGWTVVTADGKLSAHWEHTVAITPDGPRVLTARSDEPEYPNAEPAKIPVPLVGTA